jgi:ubiquinone/menaquinone biosynthesis C-methylase UbiE
VVIRMNALDHVDNFNPAASEMQRVLKKGGEMRFEVEYHAPRVCEPHELDDAQVLSAFNRCDLRLVANRSGREMFTELVKRYNLLPNQFQRFDKERFVTWSGIKPSGCTRGPYS